MSTYFIAYWVIALIFSVVIVRDRGNPNHHDNTEAMGEAIFSGLMWPLILPILLLFYFYDWIINFGIKKI